MSEPAGDAPRKRRPYASRLPAEARREQLLDAALRIAASRGLRDVNMESVAREGGVTKPVVYSAFANSDALLDALVAREQARAMQQVQATIPADLNLADPIAAATAGISSFLAAVRANPETWTVLLAADQLPHTALVKMARTRKQLLDQITVLAEAGLVERRSGPLDAELLARLIIAAAGTGARLVLVDPDAYGEERLVTFVTEVVRSIQEG
jgi:AcrR family transcriptional regulator